MLIDYHEAACKFPIIGEFMVNSNIETEAKPCFANTCEERCELLKRKPNKQNHTENQVLRSRTTFLLIDQLKKIQKRHNSSPKIRTASCHQSCLSDKNTNLERK